MKITHLVIHELEKESGTTGATLKLYDETIDPNDKRIIKMLAELNNRYKYRNESYGIFDKDNPTVFHSSFEKYYKQLNEKDFIEFTKEASKDLRKRIEDNAPAKGGFLIFARYNQVKDFVAVFVVRNITGFSFTSGVKKFDISDVEHIDFENLAMACRISVVAYKKRDIRYLSFISKNSDDMSRYFTKWVSSADTETNAEETKKLRLLLEAVELPINPETQKKYKKEDFLDSVFNFINNTPGRTINLSNLSERFFDDSKFLHNEIEQRDIILNGEFKAHLGQLRSFVQISARADEVELTFPKSLYKTVVKIDNKDKTQVIIKSAKLAEAINQLIKE